VDVDVSKEREKYWYTVGERGFVFEPNFRPQHVYLQKMNHE
jgi:hypothetical protein